MAIKVLAFDLDDTLWDMRPTLIQAEKVLADWLSSNCSQLQYDVVSMRQFREQILGAEPSLVADLSLLRKRVIRHALEISGYSSEDARNYSNKAFDVFFEARNNVIFFDGVIESLARLVCSYTLGSLTNGNADINKLGLADYFSFAFSAADVGSPKPAPDLFRAAVKHTGAAPGEMIYIGDHPLLDMDPARQFGFNTIWINRGARSFTGKHSPDQEITNLAHLPLAVDEIEKGL
ncbi:MAG: HAD-IA family hydrolase [Gammaproteobacteria bacterium]|nr:HAD-IA family hydrolase [Gammaproteobacteria bacterium]